MKYQPKKTTKIILLPLILACLASCSIQHVRKEPHWLYDEQPEPILSAERTTCIQQCGIADVAAIKPLPPENLKVNLGKIGVASSYYSPESIFQYPMDKGDAALHGAGAGSLGSFVLLCSSPSFACLGAILVAPAAALVGGVVGAVKGESLEKIRRDEEVLAGCIAKINLQDALRESVFAINKKQKQYSFVLMEGQGPREQGEKVAYDFKLYDHIDTVLETGIIKFDLKGANEINPDMILYMASRTRIISKYSGNVVYSFDVIFDKGRKFKYIDWSSDNGKLFKEEVEHAIQFIANKILEAICIVQCQANAKKPSPS